MQTLSVEQRKEWVNSWPSKAVKYNDQSGQVCMNLRVTVLVKPFHATRRSLAALPLKVESSYFRANVSPLEPLTVAHSYTQVEIEDAELYQYDDEHVEKAVQMGHPDLCHVIQKTDTFVFTVETTGSLQPQVIVRVALWNLPL